MADDRHVIEVIYDNAKALAGIYIVHKAMQTAVELTKDSIAASQQYNNTMIGLGSVARSTGQSIDATKAAAVALSKDGLMSVGESAGSLKNLLAAGFGLPQAIKLMEGFKDTAAFNRQASYSFGQSILSATEGIKNQNSILIDNMGLTKNYSVIVKEAGLALDALTKLKTNDVIREKIYQGFLKETAMFHGDAAKLTETYSGAVSRLGTQWQMTKVHIGDAITQNSTVATLLGIVADKLELQNGALSENKTAFNLVTDAVIFGVKSFKTLVVGVAAGIDVYYGLVRASQVVVREVMKVSQTVLQFGMDTLDTFAKLPGAERFWPGLATGKDFVRARLDEVNSMIFQMGLGIEDTERKSTSWATTLASVDQQLADMVGQLEMTRGKTVEVGEAAEEEGRRTAEAQQMAKEALKARAQATLEMDKAAIESMTQGFEAKEQILKAEHSARIRALAIERTDDFSFKQSMITEETKYQAAVLKLKSEMWQRVKEIQTEARAAVAEADRVFLGNDLLAQQAALDAEYQLQLQAIEKEKMTDEASKIAKMARLEEFEAKKRAFLIKSTEELIAEVDRLEREHSARQQTQGLAGTREADTMDPRERAVRDDMHAKITAVMDLAMKAMVIGGEQALREVERLNKMREALEQELNHKLQNLATAADAAADQLSALANRTPGTVGSQYPGQITVPQYGDGAIVDRPHMAVVGDKLSPGEFEAIIPSRKLGQMGGNVTNNLNIKVGSVDSESRVKQIAREVNAAMARQQRRGRRTTISTN